jgi:hypothetical protein
MKNRPRTHRSKLHAGFVLALALGCNRVEPFIPDEPSLEDFLPAPPATGGAQVAFAGVLSNANLATERIDGPASQGLPGDIFLRNDKIRVVIQQPGRSLALIPTGGNIIDADVIRQPNDPLFDIDGNAANGVGNDHWGELSILFQLGRVVNSTRCQIVADGSAGGGALVRCFGTDDIDDFLNLQGVLAGVGFSPPVDADEPLGVDIAVDYLLEPGADFVKVRYTVFNPTDKRIDSTVGILGDIGGISEPFIPGGAFGGAGFDELLGGDVEATTYTAVQAPDIGYGVVPFYLDPRDQELDPEMKGLAIVISGGLAMAYDVPGTADLLGKDDGLTVLAQAATTTGFDFVVGKRDIGVTETRFQEERLGITTNAVSGQVTIGGQPARARIAIFESDDDILDADETPITVFATDEQGNYSGGMAPGSYLLVADAEGALRAPPQRVSLAAGSATANFAIPEPGKITYTVHDVTNSPQGALTPAKINIIGDDPNPVDKRFRDVKASSNVHLLHGQVGLRYTRSGSSATDPEGAISIEPGRYRVVVSRGIEYSRFELPIDVVSGQTVDIDAEITQVVNSAGYVKGDFHQHAVTSPDSPVDLDIRALTFAAEGIEFVTSTDHDFRTDFEPVLERLNLEQFVDSAIGEETTTFDYGHFNAFPFAADPSQPNNGALDWGRGTDFFNLLPGEIFGRMRADGARVIQINHPRTGSGFAFQEYFEQSRLNYDFDNGIIASDIATSNNDVFRLPGGVALFSDNFDSFELYNGFDISDLNDDGVREERRVEIVLRDYFNMLSLGKVATVVGTSDTHSTSDPVGVPGAYVRVPNDAFSAILLGQLRDPIFDSLSGRRANNTPVPRDVVVTNAPFVTVTVNNQSAIGSLVQPQNGVVNLSIRIESPDWAQIDTVEIFANQTFANQAPGDPLEGAGADSLTPNICFTSRANRDPNDTCDANGPASDLSPFIDLNVVNGSLGARVQVIEMNIAVDLDDIANPQAPANSDQWLVVRAYGTGSLFPVIPIISNASLVDVVEQGSGQAQGGAFPLAITNAILIDTNGNNQYKGAFQP